MNKANESRPVQHYLVDVCATGCLDFWEAGEGSVLLYWCINLRKVTVVLNLMFFSLHKVMSPISELLFVMIIYVITTTALYCIFFFTPIFPPQPSVNITLSARFFYVRFLGFVKIV